MKIKINLFMLILIVFFYLSACTDQDEISPEPRVASNWLSFETKEELKVFIENGKNEELGDFQRKLQPYSERGFEPLLPYIDESDETLIEAYSKRKINEIKSFMSSSDIDLNLRLSNGDVDLNADEDVIIADPYFASVLNERREILVDNNVYRFTDKGLFYTPIENYSQLDRTIQNIHSCNILSAEGEIEVGNGVTAFIPRPIDDGCQGGGGGTCCSGGGGSGGSGPSSPTPPTREEIRDNLKVCEYRPNILNKLFGPSEKCIDHFDDRRRIKVKTWAQNYLIFASTGLKVKSQKRRFRVWWGNKIDELELGYSIASFKYTGIGNWPNPNPSTHAASSFHYELNGFIVDQYGRYVRGVTPARNLFTNFPLPDDQELVKIWIYKPIREVIKTLTGEDQPYLEYTGKNFNKAVRELVENAVGQLKKHGKKINGTPKAVLIFEDPEWNNLNFVYTNWNKAKTNENKISKVFDWNTAQIGIKQNGPKTKGDYSPPKTPKDFNIVCYGMGRRGNTWKGGRIVLSD